MTKPFDLSVAEALSDALVGYLTLQARARMYEVYSEYLLYDAVARVAHGRGWYLECEVALSSSSRTTPGDHKRIDFLIRPRRESHDCVLVELKYRPSVSRKAKVSAANDTAKLQDELGSRGKYASALLLVAGAKSRTSSKLPFPVTGLPKGTGEPLYDIAFPARHTCFGATAWRIPRQGA